MFPSFKESEQNNLKEDQEQQQKRHVAKFISLSVFIFISYSDISPHPSFYSVQMFL